MISARDANDEAIFASCAISAAPAERVLIAGRFGEFFMQHAR